MHFAEQSIAKQSIRKDRRGAKARLRERLEAHLTTCCWFSSSLPMKRSFSSLIARLSLRVGEGGTSRCGALSAACILSTCAGWLVLRCRHIAPTMRAKHGTLYQTRSSSQSRRQAGTCPMPGIYIQDGQCQQTLPYLPLCLQDPLPPRHDVSLREPKLQSVLLCHVHRL